MAEIGIDKVKKAFKEVIEFGEALAKALEDGKVTWGEGFGLAWEAKDIGYIVNNWKSIKEQWNDMSTVEENEVIDYIKAEFELSNADAEEKIERGIELAASIWEYIKLFTN